MKRNALTLLGICFVAVAISVGLWQWRANRERAVEEWQKAWQAPVVAEKPPSTPSPVPRPQQAAPTDSATLPSLPNTPNDSEVATCRAFARALLPSDAGGPGQSAENAALASFLSEYRALDRDAAWEKLREFMRGPVPERWKAALQLELAAGLFERGFFVDARDAWQAVWQRLRTRRDFNSLALADEAGGRLLDLEIGRGRANDLRQMIAENEGRPYHGSLEGKLMRARQSVWLLEHVGAQNVMCGPRALNSILDFQHTDYNPIRLDTITGTYIATGLPMSEVQKFAAQMGWSAQLVRRLDPDAPIPTPAVLHAKEGHYAALLQADELTGQYFMEDRGLGFTGWVSKEAVNQISSGNFLLASGGVPKGYESLSLKDASGIFGRDGAHGLTTTDQSSTPDVTTCGGNSCKAGEPGMAQYTFLPQMGALRLYDNPIGYDPPVGPSARLVLTYNELDSGAPTSPTEANAGRLWNVNWVSWITPPTGTLTNASTLSARPSRGGTRILTYNTTTAQFGPSDRDFTIVQRISSTNYQRIFPDGSKEIYAQPNNVSNPTRIYLTQIVDPQGNTLSFTYDAQLRLTTVTDTIGQITTLFYNHPTDVLKITSVQDPFGRTASLGYNAAGQLISITDIIGLVSSFTYSTTGDAVTKLTTPYGDTLFARTVGGNGWDRVLEATDAKGDKERVQYADPGTEIPTSTAPPRSAFVGGQQVTFFAENTRLQYRNSYYWSKKAMNEAPGDPAAARNYRWYTDKNWLVTPILEALKEPFEDRVWINYPGASGAQKTASGGVPNYPGKGARSEKTLRVLADGSPQMVQTYYNSLGLPTKTVDPLGRTTEFTYAANQTDLLTVRQTTGGTNQQLTAITYNAQHLPLTVTDAAGQVTTFTYNARGQVTTVTNPNLEVTTFNYNANGYLTSVDGALAGTADSTVFTYDAKGRPRTVTGPDGYVLTYDYDDMDRLTKVTYPDTTFEQFGYTNLDRTSYRDRLGRITTFEYNAIRQLTKTTDPASRSVLFDWCKCGDLFKLTDPMGRETRWKHDVQGRVTAKTYADGSQIRYFYEPQTSRLAQRIDEKGQTTLYSYNLDDTLRSVSYPDAKIATPTVTYAYDTVFNRLISMTDGIGTTNYTYLPITGSPAQGAGQLATVDGPWANDTVVYAYDKLGRVSSRSINGVAETTLFDPAGRPSSVTNALGTFAYGYDGATYRLASATHSGGVKTLYTYFPNTQDRRLRNITNLKADGATPLSVFDYTYDTFGRIQTWKQQDDNSVITAKTWILGHDSADQLASAIIQEGVKTVKNSAWEYDAAANRTKETIDSSVATFNYNALNELNYASATLTQATYEWDAENRLTAVNQGGARTEFTYDGLGRRVKILEKVNGTTTSTTIFLWCGLEICERRDASGGSVQQRYFSQGFQGVTGNPVGVFLYTFDHLGSTRELVDSTGTLKERIAYDAWGAPSFSNNTPLVSFAFTGHFWHASSGLSLAPFRAYETKRGRWLSRDPIGEKGGFNIYSYVSNAPLSAADPLGLYSMDDFVSDVFTDSQVDWIAAHGQTGLDAFQAGAENWDPTGFVIHTALSEAGLGGNRCSAAYKRTKLGLEVFGYLNLGHDIVKLTRGAYRLSKITVGKSGRFYGGQRGAVSGKQVGKWAHDVIHGAQEVNKEARKKAGGQLLPDDECECQE